VILENDTVWVLEATVPLHSREVPRTHFWPSVFFEQTSPVNEPWKTVTIRWSKGGPSRGFDSSDRDRHNLLIELKKTDCKPAPPADLPSTDAVKIHDPNMTVVLENEYMRVLSVRVAPGDKEPWHTHTWPAVVVYFTCRRRSASCPTGKRCYGRSSPNYRLRTIPTASPCTRSRISARNGIRPIVWNRSRRPRWLSLG
jgi:hypothetical protein